MDKEDTLSVAHVGLLGDNPGGMAQVLNEYLSWDLPNTKLTGILTTRRKHDALAPILFARAIFYLAAFAIRTREGNRVAVFHLSEGGSFIREGFLLIYSSRVLRMPTIAHIHGATFTKFANRFPRLVRRVLSSANGVAVLTTAHESELRSYLTTRARVAIVPNIVSVPNEPSIKEKEIIFCGEVSRRKGYDILSAAWSRLADEFTEWRLVVVGPHLGDVTTTDSPGVINVGSLKHEGALQRQSRASIAVLPSRDEALPMFLLEAMARECAVVATEVGEIPSLLSDGAGVVVAAGDSQGLAEQLRNLMINTELRTELGQNARKKIVDLYSTSTGQTTLITFWREISNFSEQK